MENLQEKPMEVDKSQNLQEDLLNVSEDRDQFNNFCERLTKDEGFVEAIEYINQTPYTLLKNPEGQSVLSLGTIVIAPKVFENKEEAIEYLNENIHSVLVNVIVGVCNRIVADSKKTNGVKF